MAGKGDKWRTGTDFKRYKNSRLWDKKKTVKQKPVKEKTNERQEETR